VSLPNYKNDYITEQEYLDDEKDTEIKHEYADGKIFAMAGAKKNHQRLIMTLASAWHSHLKGTPCEVFSSDVKVRADNGKKYFYPDILVVCENDESDDYYAEFPRIIVEVLSDSTRKYDKTFKRQIYQTIPTLEEYVLIEQDRVEIEVCRRASGWQSTFYFIDDEITFTSIELTLSVLDIYQRVENDEMRAFLATPPSEKSNS
jgi:Uma2 family endonuclease